MNEIHTVCRFQSARRKKMAAMLGTHSEAAGGRASECIPRVVQNRDLENDIGMGAAIGSPESEGYVGGR